MKPLKSNWLERQDESATPPSLFEGSKKKIRECELVASPANDLAQGQRQEPDQWAAFNWRALAPRWPAVGGRPRQERLN